MLELLFSWAETFSVCSRISFSLCCCNCRLWCWCRLLFLGCFWLFWRSWRRYRCRCLLLYWLRLLGRIFPLNQFLTLVCCNQVSLCVIKLFLGLSFNVCASWSSWWFDCGIGCFFISLCCRMIIYFLLSLLFVSYHFGCCTLGNLAVHFFVHVSLFLSFILSWLGIYLNQFVLYLFFRFWVRLLN